MEDYFYHEVATDHSSAAVLRVVALPVEEFLVVVEAMCARFAHDHDLMHTMVDHYDHDLMHTMVDHYLESYGS
jgi:hypothetical protein